MRKILLLLFTTLTLVSCEDFAMDVFTSFEYIDADCVNNTEDTVYVSMYGHEVGDTSHVVLQLYYSPQCVPPKSIENGKLQLNGGLKRQWENIWYSYGIDTLYVVVSRQEISVPEPRRMPLPKGDTVLKMQKYKMQDEAPKENKITISYP